MAVSHVFFTTVYGISKRLLPLPHTHTPMAIATEERRAIAKCLTSLAVCI